MLCLERTACTPCAALIGTCNSLEGSEYQGPKYSTKEGEVVRLCPLSLLCTASQTIRITLAEREQQFEPRLLLVQGPAKTPVGCTMRMAPQAVRNRAVDYETMVPYGPICDIWSAAVTLYYLLYTRWPFSDKTILEWTIDGTQVRPGDVNFPESAPRFSLSVGFSRIFRQGSSRRGSLPRIQFSRPPECACCGA